MQILETFQILKLKKMVTQTLADYDVPRKVPMSKNMLQGLDTHALCRGTAQSIKKIGEKKLSVI